MQPTAPSPTNHQVVFVRPGVAELQTRPMPVPGERDLLIRTRVSLISPGTERAFFLGLPNTPQTYPQFAGYSNIGEVVACGSGVTGWAPGDRVASAAPHAAYAVVNATHCLPVAEELPDEQAVFFNLASIALQSVRKTRLELGEPVAVIGAGLIGLLALQLARLQGALPAISIDLDPQRLEFACAVGADVTLTVDEELPIRVSQHCGGEGAAVVVEATGHPEAILTALALARPAGRVVLLGSTRGETAHVNFYRDLHKKGITLLGAHNNARPLAESSPGYWTQRDDQATTLKLLALKRLSVTPLITHRFTWRDARDAYALLQNWNRSALGMVLDWTQA